MPALIGNLGAWLIGRLPTALTFAGLIGLGVWGYLNDWKLSTGSRAGRSAGAEGDGVKFTPTPPEPGVTPSESAGPLGVVEFSSEAALNRAGIRDDEAREQSLTRQVSALGMADYDPGSYVRLGPRANGSVWRVEKQLGDQVRKGEVLALLDVAEVGHLKAQLLTNLAQVKLRNNMLVRMNGLEKQGAVSERSFLEAETQLREARIRLFNDQQGLLNLGLPLRLADFDGLTDEQQARRLRLLGLPESITREVDGETLTANLLPIAAPFDGVVVDRNAALGEVVQVNQARPLFIVADVRQIHIDLDVQPELMADVAVGQAVIFTPDAGGPTLTARVAHISPEIDGTTRRVRVHAEASNDDRRVRPNTFGVGQIIIGEPRFAVVVPAEAIQMVDQRPILFVRTGPTRFEARGVRTGLRQGGMVEVVGLRSKERVVTVGSFLLKSELEKERIAGDD